MTQLLLIIQNIIPISGVIIPMCRSGHFPVTPQLTSGTPSSIHPVGGKTAVVFYTWDEL